MKTHRKSQLLSYEMRETVPEIIDVRRGYKGSRDIVTRQMKAGIVERKRKPIAKQGLTKYTVPQQRIKAVNSGAPVAGQQVARHVS
jgi:hypothetical protein